MFCSKNEILIPCHCKLFSVATCLPTGPYPYTKQVSPPQATAPTSHVHVQSIF